MEGIAAEALHLVEILSPGACESGKQSIRGGLIFVIFWKDQTSMALCAVVGNEINLKLGTLLDGRAGAGRYRAVFARADVDGDGFVEPSEALPLAVLRALLGSCFLRKQGLGGRSRESFLPWHPGAVNRKLIFQVPCLWAHTHTHTHTASGFIPAGYVANV